MRRKSFDSLWPFALAAALLSGFTTNTFSASKPVYAVGTFQRELDTPSPGPSGIAVLTEKGSSQIFSVTINNLTGVANGGSGSFGVFLSDANTTNIPVFLIGPMSLKGTNATWVLTYEGVGAAPAQVGVADLVDLSGMYLIIANPGTNVVVDGVTNEIVNAVLYTRIPAFTTKGAAPHYNRKSPLITPAVSPPNPAEKGWVKTIYTGSQGRSVFDISAFHLSGGGSYSILIEDPPSSSTMTNIGSLVIGTNSVSTGTFTRDTRKGETLPLEMPTVSGLSGRAIEIRDAFNEIHLEGTIP
ncbi:MAG TPA: hypothetical protein VMP11_15890 [Verrucomicrobiae bacterium]|nr:hypothetical protein [Verrucomicrobiae bacterium]